MANIVSLRHSIIDRIHQIVNFWSIEKNCKEKITPILSKNNFIATNGEEKMITSEEFVERLKRLKPNCYMHGELIQRDDPRMMVSSKDIRMSFDLHSDSGWDHYPQLRSLPAKS